MQNSWYSELSSLVSLGSQHEGDGTLAGLHDARAKHLSQFFTPADVAAIVWGLVSPGMTRASERAHGARVALLDNSVGSGRLLQFADPVRHTLAGFDIHAPSIEAVARVATASGFSTDFIVAGLESVHPRGYGVALINPPFSIHLESPHLEAFPCCSFGRFGPKTACLSHVYAVAQALAAADVVAAILPVDFAVSLVTDRYFGPRLQCVIRLPSSAFASENVVSATAIAVFGDAPTGRAAPILSFAEFRERPPALDLRPGTEAERIPGKLTRHGLEFSKPTIKTPVTGNRTVRVAHHNRRIVLKFSCGLTEAKVRNFVLRGQVEDLPEHRYPKGVRFTGEGALDLQVHLIQEDPLASFAKLIAAIETAGGQPVVDPGISGYLRRQARRLARHRVPYAHVIRAEGVQVATSSTVALVAKQTALISPKKFGSPTVKQGQKVSGNRAADGTWTVQLEGKSWLLTAEEINARFTLVQATEQPTSAWVEKFPGRLKAFTALAHQARKRAEKLGLLEWLTWEFQQNDLAEVAISPFGSVVAWDMGLGKSRVAVALIMMGGSRANLIATEAHLVPEIVAELEALKIPAPLWRVIDGPKALDDLRLINVISYNRLRQAVGKKRKATYGKALRRRVGTLICDEGHVLRHLDTDQTRAAWSVAARRRYVLTGTLIANYPRDTLGILAFLGGSATAAQPYGIRGDAYLEARLAVSMTGARRGIDAFCDSFVTLEWVTNEFMEELSSGGKREVPKIANLPAYRSMLAPFVKRRVVGEPQVNKHVKIPPPRSQIIPVQWNDAHLAFYLHVADHFAAWYREARRKAGAEGHSVNLIALLARIGAVETACNIPQAGVDEFGSFHELTSKQSAAAAHIVKHARAGEKILVFARRPLLLELIGRILSANGVKFVMVHGKRSIAARTEELRKQFCNGDTPVVLASEGCAETGLNLPQTTKIVHLNRQWSAKAERQANARALRPQQKRTVTIDYFQLTGSIDDYQAQMCAWKAEAADAGLDWATPEKADQEFMHLDTILGRFVENIATLRGTDSPGLRRALAGVAA